MHLGITLPRTLWIQLIYVIISFFQYHTCTQFIVITFTLCQALTKSCWPSFFSQPVSFLLLCHPLMIHWLFHFYAIVCILLIHFLVTFNLILLWTNIIQNTAISLMHIKNALWHKIWHIIEVFLWVADKDICSIALLAWTTIHKYAKALWSVVQFIFEVYLSNYSLNNIY